MSASPRVGEGCALEGEHALGPGVAGELVGFPARLSRALGRYADGGAVKSFARLGAHGNAPGGRFGQAATIRGSAEADYQTGGVKQRISCPVDYLELLRRSAQHLMRVFAEKQRVVFN